MGLDSAPFIRHFIAIAVVLATLLTLVLAISVLVLTLQRPPPTPSASFLARLRLTADVDASRLERRRALRLHIAVAFLCISQPIIVYWAPLLLLGHRSWAGTALVVGIGALCSMLAVVWSLGRRSHSTGLAWLVAGILHATEGALLVYLTHLAEADALIEGTVLLVSGAFALITVHDIDGLILRPPPAAPTDRELPSGGRSAPSSPSSRAPHRQE